ncbi:transcription initiation factor TFIID subunit 4 isoform X2 [Brachyhypopomus gauderio]|uniref:transcription initiation factor TFIID subunit 4 isoform X2 n=1 Tax=Brachyhypopomus gauderio TaxID=698409 RepID=UPI0040426B34
MSSNKTAIDFRKTGDKSPGKSPGESPSSGAACKPEPDASVSRSDELPRSLWTHLTGEQGAGQTPSAQVTHASLPVTGQSVVSDENNSPALQPSEAREEEPTCPDAPCAVLTKAAEAVVPVNSTSPSVPPAPKIVLSRAAIRPTTPLAVGARVLPEANRVAVAGVQVTPNQTRGPGAVRGAIVTLPRASTPHQTIAVTNGPRTTSIQLPANFHIPQGMVLIRSDNGQLMLVSQQALAQAQIRGLVPKQPGVTTALKPQQGNAPATSIIRVSLPPSSATVATLIKPASSVGTAVLKSTPTTVTSIIKPSSTMANTIIKPSSGTTGPAPIPTTGTSKATPKLPISVSTGAKTISATAVSSTSSVKCAGKSSLSPSVTQPVHPVGSGPRNLHPNVPIKPTMSKVSEPITVTAETLENVKKCKNFLVTLMKLASSGTRSGNMAQNVRALVKDLLDGQMDAEEFTQKLYVELKSSPQPYLVPFLKRSLPAVRQLTPNPQLFIQQCDQPKPTSTTSSTTQKLSSYSTNSQAPRAGVQGRPPQLVLQQTKGIVVGQPPTTSPCVLLSVQNRTQTKPMVIQASTPQPGASGRPSSLQASKAPYRGPPPALHAHGFKDATPSSFRDDDDINDVASMAGVNVSEENARILACSSELVGSLVRSCRDEPLLHVAVLQQRALRIGGSLGVVEVNPDVLVMISEATQERLRDLLEKLTAVAQHRDVSYRDDWRHSQTDDVRSQVRFLEQLERMEKRRREEEERETLLRIAKSRSSSGDPEQIRLKQRAKEMQQLELAQMQHRDANLAALAALGPRKRKPLEAPGPAANQILTISL